MLALKIDVRGDVHDVTFDQSNPREYFPDGVTFVGNIAHLNCVAIAGTSAAQPRNAHAFPHIIQEPDVCGDIYIVGSDENGDPVPVDTRAVRRYMSETL